MKCFITGVNGQLGYDVLQEMTARGWECVPSGSSAAYHGILPLTESQAKAYVPLDITNREAVSDVIGEVHPDVVFHCAAWTKVDDAEDEENRPRVFAVNEAGTGFVARATEDAGAKLLYLSTDYVFDGQGDKPWDPDNSPIAPLNIYGESKWKGEEQVRTIMTRYDIVRISWVFGLNGGNFVKTMLRLSETHDHIRVVSDQIGRPTYTPDLARLLGDMAESGKTGVYHATNEGREISWYDFACAIFREAGKEIRVDPVTTEEYGISKAARPRNSRMDTSKLVRDGFQPLPDWEDALARYVRALKG